MSEAAKQQVHYFWPEARLEALRAYAADESEPADAFARSKRMAWMREFCMEAPGWLQTMATRERLRNRVEAALVANRAVQGQLEGVLHDLEGMSAPPKLAQDRWAEAIASVPPEQRPKPAAKPRMQQVDWVPLSAEQPGAPLAEAVAEADELPAERPKGPARVPAEGEQLPAERLWDEAHGKPAQPTNFKVQLDKLPPDAKARILGKANPQPLGPSAEQVAMRKRAAQIAQSIKEDPGAWEMPLDEAGPEQTLVPNPDELPPQEHEGVELEQVPVSEAEGVQPAKAQVARASAEAEATTPFKSADGKVRQRARRTGFRMELRALEQAHGVELATFVAHDILKDAVSTRAIRQIMSRFMGTFDDRVAASSNCAYHYGQNAVDEFFAGKDVLRNYAEGLHLEHENGRCSWWRK